MHCVREICALWQKIQWLSQKSAISPFRNSETAIISCFGYSNSTDISVSLYRCIQITAKALLKSLRLSSCMHIDNSRYLKTIFIKFRIEESYKIMSSYLYFHCNLTLLTLNLRGELHAFLLERANTCLFREHVRSHPVILTMLSTYS